MIMEMRAGYIENPKTKGSGIVCAIPQTGECPNKCEDCFFQSGRSYLEPLDENLPNLPIPSEVFNKVIRINDGNDSNNRRGLVQTTAQCYHQFFFNTATPKTLGAFPGPVVLTINPAKKTDKSWHKVEPVPNNLMFVRIRVNMWNIDNVVIPAVKYYTEQGVPVVFTYMAYYTTTVPEEHQGSYTYKKRTTNSYWVLNREEQKRIMDLFDDNPLVHECGYKGTHSCKHCGNCLREYFATKERMEMKK